MANFLYRQALTAKRKIGNAWNDVTGKTASRDAARAQTQGADQAAGTLRDAFGQARELQTPYLEAGRQDYGRLRDLVSGGAFDMPDERFEAPAFNFQADPGYAFRQAEGEKAVTRRNAVQGRALGGGALKDLMRFNQGLASEEVGNAYNRFAGNRAFEYGNFADRQGRRSNEMGARFGRLAGLADVGPQTAQNLGNQSIALGGSLADLQLDRANARAAGRVGGYNTQRDTLMGLLSAGAQYAGARRA